MASKGRPKNVRPNEIRLHVPSDSGAIMKNKAKRIYWALLEMEKKMSKDITSVKMKEYTDLLDAYETVCNDLRRKGYVGRYAQKRVVKQGMVQDEFKSLTPRDSQDGSLSVGSGIPPNNPLT